MPAEVVEKIGSRRCLLMDSCKRAETPSLFLPSSRDSGRKEERMDRRYMAFFCFAWKGNCGTWLKP